MVSFLAVDSSFEMRCHQQTSLPVCGKRAFGFELLTEKEVHEHRCLTFPKKEPFRKSDEASEEDISWQCKKKSQLSGPVFYKILFVRVKNTFLEMTDAKNKVKTDVRETTFEKMSTVRHERRLQIS